MKYLLTISFVLFFSLSNSAQRTIGFRTDIGSSQFIQYGIGKVNFGLTYKSKWMLNYGVNFKKWAFRDFLSDYRGQDIEETIFYQSIEVGKMVALKNTKLINVGFQLGLHTGMYEGPVDFVKTEPPNSNSGLFNALVDFLSNSHSYTIEEVDLLGINGSIFLNLNFQNKLFVIIGLEGIHNQKFKTVGVLTKIGYRF